MTLISGLLVLGIAICLFLPLYSSLQARQSAYGRGFSYRRSPAQSSYNQELFRQLVNLVYGDFDQANRLIGATMMRHPDRPMDWLIEKTIQDLIRDRSR